MNRYLKWAYSEAGNVVARHHKAHPHRHVSLLYARIRKKRGHQVAVRAVERHLAEATNWMLKRGEPYVIQGFVPGGPGRERGVHMG